MSRLVSWGAADGRQRPGSISAAGFNQDGTCFAVALAGSGYRVCSCEPFAVCPFQTDGEIGECCERSEPLSASAASTSASNCANSASK
jgi:hypothetical protein